MPFKGSPVRGPGNPEPLRRGVGAPPSQPLELAPGRARQGLDTGENENLSDTPALTKQAIEGLNCGALQSGVRTDRSSQERVWPGCLPDLVIVSNTSRACCPDA